MKYFCTVAGLVATTIICSASLQAQDCAGDAVYDIHNENIQKTIEDAKSFKAGRDFFVRDFNDDENIYLKAALLADERKDYIEKWKDPKLAKCLEARLNELAEVAEKTIGEYRPVGYTFGTPAEKNILKGGVDDLSKATVFGVGLKSDTWKISKDDYGLPKYRYRYGMVWAKYPGEKVCRIIYVNLIQDYSGGGTYNTSEARFINSEPSGCPAGK